MRTATFIGAILQRITYEISLPDEIIIQNSPAVAGRPKAGLEETSCLYLFYTSVVYCPREHNDPPDGNQVISRIVGDLPRDLYIIDNCNCSCPVGVRDIQVRVPDNGPVDARCSFIQECPIFSSCRSVSGDLLEKALYHVTQEVVLCFFGEHGGEKGTCCFCTYRNGHYERFVGNGGTPDGGVPRQQTGAEPEGEQGGSYPSGDFHFPALCNDYSGKASEFRPAGVCLSFVCFETTVSVKTEEDNDKWNSSAKNKIDRTIGPYRQASTGTRCREIVLGAVGQTTEKMHQRRGACTDVYFPRTNTMPDQKERPHDSHHHYPLLQNDPGECFC